MAVEGVVVVLFEPACDIEYDHIADKRRLAGCFDFFAKLFREFICLIDTAQLEDDQRNAGEQILILF